MVLVMLLPNADKIFYMANFMKNLHTGNYSLYYLTSKTLILLRNRGRGHIANVNGPLREGEGGSHFAKDSVT